MATTGGDRRLGWKEVLSSAPTNAQILVVDDERDVRQSLERLLERFGYDVRTAASAEEADAWLNDLRFDVVLLDIQLPLMKGPEFLDWTLERFPETAVIMLTGLDDPDLAVECLSRGARTYLVKPVDPAFLGLAIRDALAVRRLLIERNDLTG